jgi:putative endonuclease
VYLLHSAKDNGFYIGYSTDLKRRLSEHMRRASFATKSRGPWKLIYYEAYTERDDAEGREKFLKSGAGRRFLRAQLRHYLRVKGCASRGSTQDYPTVQIMSHVSRRLLRGLTSRPKGS